MPFKIVIVEDEPECSRMLESYIERYCAEEALTVQIRTFPSADRFLEEYAGDTDILFMDICMEGTDGMTAAHKLREVDKEIVLIFVTTMAKFAVEGYDVNAFNYIVKPISYYEFRLKVDKAFRSLRGGRRKISLPMNGEQRWLDHKDIVYVEVTNHYLNYHTAAGEKLTVYGSLKQLEEHLSPDLFARCNACYIVNMAYVSGVKGFELELTTGDRLQISQSKRKQFMQALTRYFGGGGSINAVHPFDVV